MGVGAEDVVDSAHVAFSQHGRLGVGSDTLQRFVAEDRPRGRGAHGVVGAEVGAVRHENAGGRVVVKEAVDRPAVWVHVRGVALDGVEASAGGLDWGQQRM